MAGAAQLRGNAFCFSSSTDARAGVKPKPIKFASELYGFGNFCQ
jgi:hypothetical protein